MFKGHPKGLYVLFFTEMWERFGFYTMLAIFVLYLQENFHWDETTVTNIYGLFLAGVYFTPIVGGWIADNLLGYGRTIRIGAGIMCVGYALMAIPINQSQVFLLYAGLAIIAIGNGLFKANISVLVGNLYRKSEGSMKDAAFNIFYMGINIGAFYSPQAAKGIKDFFTGSLHLSTASGYNAGFGLAAIGMLISMTIFTIFKKHYNFADHNGKDKDHQAEEETLTKEETRSRILALVSIFAIVIFFWMAFMQNGSVLTLFAKHYTSQTVGRFTALLFDVIGLHGIIFLILGGAVMLGRHSVSRSRLYGGGFFLAGLLLILYKLSVLPEKNAISPEQFQSFNPMFIVLLTPVIVGLFSFLNRKGKEPSSPAKIGLGMAIAGISYLIMVKASIGLPAVFSLHGGHAAQSVTPFWLIGTYFSLTIAELCLSPMGLSFVSKVAPPKMRGLMMGGWFFANAIGNYLAGYIGRFYQHWEIHQFFLLLVVTSFLSAVLVAVFLKKLKATTN